MAVTLWDVGSYSSTQRVNVVTDELCVVKCRERGG